MSEESKYDPRAWYSDLLDYQVAVLPNDREDMRKLILDMIRQAPVEDAYDAFMNVQTAALALEWLNRQPFAITQMGDH